MINKTPVEFSKEKYIYNQPKQTIDQKTFDDYVAFFTTEHGTDILPYAYLGSGNLYDKMLERNPSYYLFNDEVSLIKSNSHKISQYLSDIKELIEIGPGSNRAVNNKTIPILNCAPNLKNYYAIDHSINYLTDACKCIASSIPKLNIFPLEANLLQNNSIKIDMQTTARKAVMLLGSTLENFSIEEKNHIIRNISNFMAPNDIFILTVDTNQDEKSLNLAYSNIDTTKFIMEALHYFTTINPDFSKHLNSFEVECTWNKELHFLDMYFIVKQELSFYFPGYGDIVIREGQKLKGIKSRKPMTNNVVKLLNNNSLSVINTFTNSDKMKMFICKKM